MRKKTIIVVDDDPTNLTAALNALEDHFDVLTLNSGEKLLATLKKTTPDMILLDVEMPVMSGYDVIKIIKEDKDTAGIPVIFLTSKSDSEYELKGLELGAVDYIFKPPPPPKLLQKRIDVHLTVEDQKEELLEQKMKLINFNKNLQQMVEEKTRSVLELQRVILKTMAELVERRDDVTGEHIERTTRYLNILLDAMVERKMYLDTISSWDVSLFLQSAQLHDVGKIAVRDCVLNKPGKLTPEEFEEIKRHTLFGEEIIEKIKKGTSEQSFLEYAGIFAVTHHEKWDGTGYPRGLTGEDIPLKGRLMAIADVYDALVSDRPYKKAFSHNDAVDIIKSGRGSHFDPALVDLFVEIADEFDKVHAEFSGRSV